MGIYKPKPYRKLSKITGLFYWFQPPPVEFLIKKKGKGSHGINKVIDYLK